MRHLPWLILVAAALTFAACGGGGGGGGSGTSWEPDTDVLSDEGSTAMVSVPAGTGKVGIKNKTVLRGIPKKPRDRYRKSIYRDKEFKAFQIDKYEVTNHNYYLFLETLDKENLAKWRPRHQIKGVRHECWKYSKKRGRAHYVSDKGNLPVTGIPIAAARAYAQWRGKRLPDEFEWEYAARGKEGFMYGAGTDSYRTARSKCNVADSWKGSPRMLAVNHERNMKDVSPFGCIAMGGNVSEWCDTKEIREYNVATKAGKVKKGKRFKYHLKAWRGPNFNSAGALECVLSYQGYMNPRPKVIGDTLQFTIGFRCAK